VPDFVQPTSNAAASSTVQGGKYVTSILSANQLVECGRILTSALKKGVQIVQGHAQDVHAAQDRKRKNTTVKWRILSTPTESGQTATKKHRSLIPGKSVKNYAPK